MQTTSSITVSRDVRVSSNCTFFGTSAFPNHPKNKSKTMGNTLKCDSCGPAVNHSVFTFSEDLVLKITEGRPPRGLSNAKMKALEDAGDDELFEELRCIDDSHTKAYGLSESRVQLLLEELERVIDDMSIKSGACSSDVVAQCYAYNQACPIKCDEDVTKYEECVDEATREKLQEVFKKEKR